MKRISKAGDNDSQEKKQILNYIEEADLWKHPMKDVPEKLMLITILLNDVLLLFELILASFSIQL